MVGGDSIEFKNINVNDVNFGERIYTTSLYQNIYQQYLKKNKESNIKTFSKISMFLISIILFFVFVSPFIFYSNFAFSIMPTALILSICIHLFLKTNFEKFVLKGIIHKKEKINKETEQ